MKKVALLLFFMTTTLIAFCPSFSYDLFISRIEITKKIIKIEKIYAKIERIYYIAYAIRELETKHKYFKNGKLLKGESGEEGAYQFMPSTYRYLSKKFFGKVLSKTKENQDLLAFKYLESLLNKNYSVKQIASMWNSGKPNSMAHGVNKHGISYSVPKYINKFLTTYNKVINTNSQITYNDFSSYLTIVMPTINV